MSKTGKNPIQIPEGTTVDIQGDLVLASGKLGKLEHKFTDDVNVEKQENLIVVKPANDSKVARMMWGTTRSLIDNIVSGVTTGFSKSLDLVGVGYRASMQGNTLVILLGYSHDVKYDPPEGIKIQVENQTKIIVSGIDKELVGKVAAKIRSFRKPEPYKGKGVKYSDEVIVRKEKKK